MDSLFPKRELASMSEGGVRGLSGLEKQSLALSGHTMARHNWGVVLLLMAIVFITCTHTHSE